MLCAIKGIKEVKTIIKSLKEMVIFFVKGGDIF